MTQFFRFEADFVDSLRCIPMQVRYKLDTCGIKLKLHQWSKFSERDRRLLAEIPCQTAEDIQIYREHLQQLVKTRVGEVAKDLPIEANPDWEKITTIPASVAEKADETGVNLNLEHWQTLTDIQRFALIKLSRSNHENRNFLPALKEFQVV
ncbi:nitrate reductase associated protein [Leptothoe spongobia]|uniref:Nitrate reductase associated protein n=1 Tax=Leptothoe spongobia TAU-MAC 1115 TaxID=1967444 RepID=A0A947DH91_9CYAN|nr:nitrate reductase associated protein [Leptothoe spongobia]MBT9316861.1 nitrate reductase associated protein [Leptothoe spongobia TAU-MAC 1115]